MFLWEEDAWLTAARAIKAKSPATSIVAWMDTILVRRAACSLISARVSTSQLAEMLVSADSTGASRMAPSISTWISSRQNCEPAWGLCWDTYDTSLANPYAGAWRSAIDD